VIKIENQCSLPSGTTKGLLPISAADLSALAEEKEAWHCQVKEMERILDYMIQQRDQMKVELKNQTFQPGKEEVRGEIGELRIASWQLSILNYYFY
jgi:hypothetical protein